MLRVVLVPSKTDVSTSNYKKLTTCHVMILLEAMDANFGVSTKTLKARFGIFATMLRAALVSSETAVSTSTYEGFKFSYNFVVLINLDAKLEISAKHVEGRFSSVENRRKHVEL